MSKQKANGHAWQADPDLKVESGKAAFRVGGHVLEMRLASFADFHALCNLLEVSKRLGRAEGLTALKGAIQGAMDSTT